MWHYHCWYKGQEVHSCRSFSWNKKHFNNWVTHSSTLRLEMKASYCFQRIGLTFQLLLYLDYQWDLGSGLLTSRNNHFNPSVDFSTHPAVHPRSSKISLSLSVSFVGAAKHGTSNDKGIDCCLNCRSTSNTTTGNATAITHLWSNGRNRWSWQQTNSQQGGMLSTFHLVLCMGLACEVGYAHSMIFHALSQHKNLAQMDMAESLPPRAKPPAEYLGWPSIWPNNLLSAYVAWKNRFPSSQEWALDHTFSRKNLPTILSRSLPRHITSPNIH